MRAVLCPGSPMDLSLSDARSRGCRSLFVPAGPHADDQEAQRTSMLCVTSNVLVPSGSAPLLGRGELASRSTTSPLPQTPPSGRRPPPIGTPASCSLDGGDRSFVDRDRR